MEVEELKCLQNQVVGAVGGVSGDVKAVGVKVDGVELEIAGVKGEPVGTRKLLEKTHLRAEAVGQTSMARGKKFIQIEAWLLMFESGNQEGNEGQARRRNKIEGDGD